MVLLPLDLWPPLFPVDLVTHFADLDPVVDSVALECVDDNAGSEQPPEQMLHYSLLKNRRGASGGGRCLPGSTRLVCSARHKQPHTSEFILVAGCQTPAPAFKIKMAQRENR